MQIGVTADVARAMKGLKRLNKKQVPFAAALGLTNTAKRLAKTEQRMMVKQLDRPTPFTVRGIRWQRANKADYVRGALHSRVYTSWIGRPSIYAFKSRAVRGRQAAGPSRCLPAT